MNNNDIDYGLNSTGTYLNRIAEYFKAMNKPLKLLSSRMEVVAC